MISRIENCSPLHWQSRKLKRVIKSTLAAECLALQDAAENGMYLKTLIQEILGADTETPIDTSIHSLTDNKSLVDSLHSTKTLENKRLILDRAVIKDMMKQKDINSVQWVDTHDQLADCLTKRTASSAKLLQVLFEGKLHINVN